MIDKRQLVRWRTILHARTDCALPPHHALQTEQRLSRAIAMYVSKLYQKREIVTSSLSTAHPLGPYISTVLPERRD